MNARLAHCRRKETINSTSRHRPKQPCRPGERGHCLVAYNNGCERLAPRGVLQQAQANIAATVFPIHCSRLPAEVNERAWNCDCFDSYVTDHKAREQLTITMTFPALDSQCCNLPYFHRISPAQGLQLSLDLEDARDPLTLSRRLN